VFVFSFFGMLLFFTFLIKSFSPSVDVSIGDYKPEPEMENIEEVKKNVDNRLAMIQDEDQGRSFTDLMKKAEDAETEAQEEFKQLYLVLMTYPPNIGLWLRIKSSGAKSEINNIIEWYQKMLVNRGFRYQIGFYNTKDELERFDWQKFCNNRAGADTQYKDFDRTSVSNYFANDWNLWWLDNPTADEFKQTEELLRPNFFKLIPAGTSTANPSAYVNPRI
jgi:hypothetical protein